MSAQKSHRDFDDATFLSLFAGQSLPPELFNHEAHLRLAFLHLQENDPEQAVEIVSRQILEYVKKLGAEDKFHATLTIAAVKVVQHFMKRAPLESFEALLRRFPRLSTHFKELITSHYSEDIFTNPTARKQYMEPDLLPFT